MMPILAMNDRGRFSRAGDGHDLPRPVGERIPSITAVIDDVGTIDRTAMAGDKDRARGHSSRYALRAFLKMRAKIAHHALAVQQAGRVTFTLDMIT